MRNYSFAMNNTSTLSSSNHLDKVNEMNFKIRNEKEKCITGSRQEKEHLSRVMWEKHKKPASPLDVMSEHCYVHKDGWCFHFTNYPPEANALLRGFKIWYSAWINGYVLLGTLICAFPQQWLGTIEFIEDIFKLGLIVFPNPLYKIRWCDSKNVLMSYKWCINNLPNISRSTQRMESRN